MFEVTQLLGVARGLANEIRSVSGCGCGGGGGGVDSDVPIAEISKVSIENIYVS
jgi:hypothetical protein